MLAKLCGKVLGDENEGAKRLDGLSHHSLLAQSRQDIRQMTQHPYKITGRITS